MNSREKYIKKFFVLISTIPLIYVVYKSEMVHNGIYRY